MPNYPAIHDFATRYRDIYTNRNITESDVSDNFSEQCFELDFEMDCGKSFMDLSQNAPFYNPDVLEEVIDEIVDTMLIDAVSIIREVEQFFRKGYDVYAATDVGSWELRLANKDGDIFKTHGALISGHNALDALSDLIRRETGHCDLFLFNGDIS